MHILSIRPAKLTCLITALLLLAVNPAWPLSGESSEVARCKGHGVINFQGDGTLYISGDGVLVVNEGVEVVFDTEVSECYPQENGGCSYILIKGKAWVSGEGIKASFSGANIGLTASGNATLALKGYGIYRVGVTLGRWSINGTTINLTD